MRAQHVCALSLITFLAACALMPSGAQAGSPLLDEIQSTLREYYGSITSISVKGSTWQIPNPDYRLPPPAWGPRTVEWREQGDLRLFTAEAVNGAATREWASFDGKEAFFLACDDQGNLLTVSVQESFPLDLEERYELVHFMGLRVAPFQRSLADLLSEGQATIASEPEDVDGAPCRRIIVGTFKNRADFDFRLTVWLDPQKGWLPRRMMQECVSSPEFLKEHGVTVSIDSMTVHHFVVSFDVANDLGTGSSRNYPRELRSTGVAGTGRFVVENVRFGERLRPDECRPTIPDGTMVYVGRGVPGQPPRRFVQGGEKAVDQLVAQRLREAEQAKYPVVGGLPLLKAELTEGWSARRLLFWISVGALAALAGWRVLRGRIAS